MFKWLHYWKLGRAQKKRMDQILDTARQLPPYTPTTEEVLAFIDDMNAHGTPVNVTHYMQHVQRPQIYNILDKDVRLS